jgi:hypothetical protein
MTDALYFLAGTLTGVPVLYGSFLIARWLKRRRDYYKELWSLLDERQQFRGDVILMSKGEALTTIPRVRHHPRLSKARNEAKETAQAFIKRYAGCAVPKEDKP